MCISPTDDSLLSGSLDKTLRLWDLRSPNCHGLMHMLGKPVASFDPEGLIFTVGVNKDSVKLYDLRSFEKGPFITFRFSHDKDSEWASLKFSPDGRTMMVCTDGSMIRLVDAINSQLLQAFAVHVTEKSPPSKTIKSIHIPR